MSVQIVYPYSADFDADGTANVAQAQQVSLSKLAADHELSFTSSSIFDAFTVADGATDASGEYVVTYSGGAGALKTALEGAQSGANETLQQILQRLLKTEVEGDLSTTGLFNIFEAEELTDVTVPNSAIGDAGSAAMDAVLSESDVNIVVAQIPYARLTEVNQNGGNLNTILVSGDSIVFNFTVRSNLVVQPVLHNYDSTTGATAGGSAEASFTSAEKSRTVNLTIFKA